MAQLTVTITAASPLCFSERRPGGQFRYSTDYVSGAVIRGAVAAVMLQAGRDTKTVFQRLFGVGQPPAALFRWMYPSTYVLPHTALSCKDNAGFICSGASHGVFDALITRLCFEHLQPPGVLYSPRCQHDDCQPGRVEAFSGFYSSNNGTYSLHHIPQRLLTRVGINRRRMAAEDALLYAPMVLSEAWWEGEKINRASFTGTVWVEDDLAETLSSTLHEVKHLGSGASRGLGEVHVYCERDTAGSDRTARRQAVTQRVETFNGTLQTQWKEVTSLCNGPSPPCPQVFTINLRADAILKESGWLPTTVLTDEMLREATGVADDSLRLLRSYASYDYRGGWDTGKRLPKDTELVTRMGSVFVFQVDDFAPWIGALTDLEIRGIGERTAEGFGEVIICDPFHVEGKEPK